MSDIPDWVVGRAFGKDQLHIVSPAKPGPAHDTESLMTIAVHELIHCITGNLVELTMDYPCWLMEGVAIYYAKQFQHPGKLNYLKTGEFPSLTKLSNQSDLESVKQVYELSYTIIEFIIERWGEHKLTLLLQNNGDISSALGIAASDFEVQWQEFVTNKYLSR